MLLHHTFKMQRMIDDTPNMNVVCCTDCEVNLTSHWGDSGSEKTRSSHRRERPGNAARQTQQFIEKVTGEEEEEEEECGWRQAKLKVIRKTLSGSSHGHDRESKEERESRAVRWRNNESSTEEMMAAPEEYQPLCGSWVEEAGLRGPRSTGPLNLFLFSTRYVSIDT
ncbi:hypothetical protein PAMP_010647 [Pampus punctatissimus]